MIVDPNWAPVSTFSPDCGTPVLVFTVSKVNSRSTPPVCVPSNETAGAVPSPLIEKSRAVDNLVASSALVAFAVTVVPINSLTYIFLQ